MKKTLLLVISFSLLGCTQIKNIMFPRKDNCSIIGISIQTNPPILFKNKPEVVYFAKLNEKGENNLGKNIISSNYIKGDYAYLINAQPGRYAAIGSFLTHTENGYNTLYDANIIKNTVIDVEPNQIVFVGDIYIKNNMEVSNWNIEKHADKTQLHYYNLLNTSTTSFFYCGTLISAERNKEMEKDFLLKTKSYFKNTKWSPLIEKRLDEIDK